MCLKIFASKKEENTFIQSLSKQIRMSIRDEKQKLRLNRALMGMVSYCILYLTIIAFYNMGFLGLSFKSVVLIIAIGVIFNLTVIVTILTGWNRHFSDPSLTTVQIITGGIIGFSMVYFSKSYWEIWFILHFIAFIFGIFKYNGSQLLALAGAATCVYILILLMFNLKRDGYVNLAPEMLKAGIMGIVMMWFSLLGGYISKLRQQITTANKELKKLVEELERMATHDELTSLFNRRSIFSILGREISNAKRYSFPLSVCIIDIDFFKRINDTFGHLTGDKILKSFADLLSSMIRKVDYVGRYGGEEFILILSNTDIKGAIICAERIRCKIENYSFPDLPEGYAVTASFGVTQYDLEEDTEQLLQRADQALYEAKRHGRNCVAFYLPGSKEIKFLTEEAEFQNK